jgi:hypothetical protein
MLFLIVLAHIGEISRQSPAPSTQGEAGSPQMPIGCPPTIPRL